MLIDSKQEVGEMKSYYSKRHNVGTFVPINQLRVGMQIHLSYTNFGCVWKITSIEPKNSKNETWLNLSSPISGKTKRTNAKYATYIRADENRLTL